MKPSLTRNVATSWAVTASGVVYALFITPVVVKALGQEQYGVWSFLNGLMGYSSLLYLGVGSALVKYIATYSASHDQASINRLTSVAVTIFAGLGGIALLVFSRPEPVHQQFSCRRLTAGDRALGLHRLVRSSVSSSCACSRPARSWHADGP